MFGKTKGRDGSAVDTLIGAGTTVTGDVMFRGGLRLEGRVVGDVSAEPGAEAELTVGQSGVVEGTVNVGSVVLGGTVLGDVVARDRVELGATSRVDGNVRYAVLEMAAGARVNGRLIHQSGGEAAEGAGAPARQLAEGD